MVEGLTIGEGSPLHDTGLVESDDGRGRGRGGRDILEGRLLDPGGKLELHGCGGQLCQFAPGDLLTEGDSFSRNPWDMAYLR